MNLAAGILTGGLAGVLGALLGVGGGIVMVPILVLFFSQETRVAIATSLATIIPIALMSTYRYARSTPAAPDGLVNWRIVGILTIGALIGAYAGTMLAPRIPTFWLRRLFATWLLITAVQMFLKK